VRVKIKCWNWIPVVIRGLTNPEAGPASKGHHHGLQKPQRQLECTQRGAAKHNRELVSKYPPAAVYFPAFPPAAMTPQPPKTNPHSVPKPASRAPLASPRRRRRRRRPPSRASGFKAAASLPPPAAARSMPFKSGAPKYRWVGPQGHSLLIGMGFNGGSDYFVVHTDQVSRRRLCQRCC
jgi:hypothetical protein